uniref:Uncharacterized protein n=1 Tax=Timema tahoe TaxID=61484 RepID=A0A7R9INP3_9NEOP|nr:unnamed protein product [Timema tahoe]
MGVILFLSGLLMTSGFEPQPGIGKETARGLAKRGARVILACRNLEAADKVKDEIISSTGNSSVVVKKLDLSSLESVRQFANDVNRSEKRLDVLVHNAGYANTFSKQVTGDGLEITMATNHYGPFLLTHLLIGERMRVWLTVAKSPRSQLCLKVVFWCNKELLAKSPRSQLCLKVVFWCKKELLAKYPRSQLCLKVVFWCKKELLAKSPRSQLCLKVVFWCKKELLAKYPRSQLCLKVVFWCKKELLAKSPRSQLFLKLVFWSKKELLATSTNQRCETCLKI